MREQATETREYRKPPRDWWREVPCGHPQDPVAWWGPHGPFCHCGWFLDVAAAVEIPTDAPGPVVQCGKCGCYPAIPPEAEFVTSVPRSPVPPDRRNGDR